MTKLSDTHYLKRASGYSAPLNGNERLPIVYGDLTDGSNGVWTLPCLSSADDVYAFAGHAVLPLYELLTLDVAPGGAGWAAGDTITGVTSGKTCVITEKLTALTYTVRSRNGNFTGGEVLTNGVNTADQGILFPTFTNGSITIYEDGQELNSNLYTFNEANNYEGHGIIATIDFATPKANAVITARGKGKVLTGTTLMENIIDIVNDFLTVECDFTSSLFESTAKARASQLFTAQAYKAAGVIDQDTVIWEIITAMMGSFLGSVYLNGEGALTLDIDKNTIPYEQVPIIRRGDGVLTDAKIRRDNIVNQVPAHYAYNYVTWEFKKQTDDTAHADAISQGIFGVRKPNTPYQFYWCRDLTSVQVVQDVIVAKLKNPLYEIEINDTTIKRIEVDKGDFIAYSADRLYGTDGQALLNQYWKVISIRPEIAKNKIRFRALQTTNFMTIAYLADGSHLADGSIKAGSDRDTTGY